MAGFGFNVKVTEEGTEQRPAYEELPNGTYKLEVTDYRLHEDGEVGSPNRKEGYNPEITVIEPEELKGRKLWEYFNVTHPNDVAQRIGIEGLQKLMRAMGIDEVNEDEGPDKLNFNVFYADIGWERPSKKDLTRPVRKTIVRYYYPDQMDEPPVTKIDEIQPPNPRPDAGQQPSAAPAPRQQAAPVQERPKASRPWGQR